MKHYHNHCHHRFWNGKVPVAFLTINFLLSPLHIVTPTTSTSYTCCSSKTHWKKATSALASKFNWCILMEVDTRVIYIFNVANREGDSISWYLGWNCCCACWITWMITFSAVAINTVDRSWMRWKEGIAFILLLWECDADIICLPQLYSLFSPSYYAVLQLILICREYSLL